MREITRERRFLTEKLRSIDYAREYFQQVAAEFAAAPTTAGFVALTKAGANLVDQADLIRETEETIADLERVS